MTNFFHGTKTEFETGNHTDGVYLVDTELYTIEDGSAKFIGDVENIDTEKVDIVNILNGIKSPPPIESMMIMTVNPNGSNTTFTLPFTVEDVVSVDWGDGSTEKTVAHTYTATGAKIVVVKTVDQPSAFSFYNKTGSKILTSIHFSTVDFANITSFIQCFRDCSSLVSVCENIFSTAVAATNFSTLFYNCSSLRSVPENLFANNTKVTNFSTLFYNCSSLLSVPENLFANNIEVTNFSTCFYNCSSLLSVPENLFANNIKATSLRTCFQDCSSLTAIPENLFTNNTNVTHFGNCFYGCSSLTAIPANLFTNNTKVTNYSYCFRGCAALTEIPTNLFRAPLEMP